MFNGIKLFKLLRTQPPPSGMWWIMAVGRFSKSDSSFLCNFWSLCESKSSVSTHVIITHSSTLLSTSSKVPHPYWVSKASWAHGGLQSGQTIHTQTNEGQGTSLNWKTAFIFTVLTSSFIVQLASSPSKDENRRKKEGIILAFLLSEMQPSFWRLLRWLLFDSHLCLQHFISLWFIGVNFSARFVFFSCSENHIHPFFPHSPPEHTSACILTLQGNYHGTC